MHHDGQGTRLPVQSSYLPRVIALKLISELHRCDKKKARDGLPEFDGKMRVEHRHPRLGTMAGGVNGDIPASIYQCDERCNYYDGENVLELERYGALIYLTHHDKEMGITANARSLPRS